MKMKGILAFLLIPVALISGAEKESVLIDNISNIVTEESTKGGDSLANLWRQKKSQSEQEVNEFLNKVAKSAKTKLNPIIKGLVKLKNGTVEKPELTSIYKVNMKISSSFIKELALKRAQSLAPDAAYNGTIKFSDKESVLIDNISKIVAEESKKGGDSLANLWREKKSQSEQEVNAFLNKVAKSAETKLDPIIKSLVKLKNETLEKPELTSIYKVNEKITSSYIKELALKRAQSLAPDVAYNGTIKFSDKTEENNILNALSATLAKEALINNGGKVGEAMKKVEPNMKSLSKFVSQQSKDKHKSGLNARSYSSGPYFGNYGDAYDQKNSYEAAQKITRRILNTYTYKTIKTVTSSNGVSESFAKESSVRAPEGNSAHIFNQLKHGSGNLDSAMGIQRGIGTYGKSSLYGSDSGNYGSSFGSNLGSGLSSFQRPAGSLMSSGSSSSLDSSNKYFGSSSSNTYGSNSGSKGYLGSSSSLYGRPSYSGSNFGNLGTGSTGLLGSSGSQFGSPSSHNQFGSSSSSSKFGSSDRFSNSGTSYGSSGLTGPLIGDIGSSSLGGSSTYGGIGSSSLGGIGSSSLGGIGSSILGSSSTYGGIGSSSLGGIGSSSLGGIGSSSLGGIGSSSLGGIGSSSLGGVGSSSLGGISSSSLGGIGSSTFGSSSLGSGSSGFGSSSTYGSSSKHASSSSFGSSSKYGRSSSLGDIGSSSLGGIGSSSLGGIGSSSLGGIGLSKFGSSSLGSSGLGSSVGYGSSGLGSSTSYGSSLKHGGSSSPGSSSTYGSSSSLGGLGGSSYMQTTGLGSPGSYNFGSNSMGNGGLNSGYGSGNHGHMSSSSSSSSSSKMGSSSNKYSSSSSSYGPSGVTQGILI